MATIAFIGAVILFFQGKRNLSVVVLAVGLFMTLAISALIGLVEDN